MKIRTGFVSNSSSSSFVLLTSKENHENILSTFSPEDRKLLDIFFEFTLEENSLFGIPTVSISYVSGNSEDYLYDDIQGYDKFEELLEEFKEDNDDESIKIGNRRYFDNDSLIEKIFSTFYEYKRKCKNNKDLTFISNVDC